MAFFNKANKEMKPEDFAGIIDHTLLRMDAKPNEVVNLCREAVRYSLRGVCVNPCFIGLVSGFVAGQGVVPVSVAGFPLGANMSKVKAFEATEAVRMGAKELDMVANIGELKAGKAKLVQDDIAAVVNAVAPVPVKVILETALLTDEEIVSGCKIAMAAGAKFVKTSTGFGPGGATVRAVEIMKKTVGKKIKIKASGGISSYKQALELVRAGADIIGASASAKIVAGL